jgi:hypothetical protein
VKEERWLELEILIGQGAKVRLEQSLSGLLYVWPEGIIDYPFYEPALGLLLPFLEFYSTFGLDFSRSIG